MGDALELLAHRLVDERVTMAVDVAPQGRDAVDVAPAVGVHEVGALGRLDHQRLSPRQSRICVNGCQTCV